MVYPPLHDATDWSLLLRKKYFKYPTWGQVAVLFLLLPCLLVYWAGLHAEALFEVIGEKEEPQ